MQEFGEPLDVQHKQCPMGCTFTDMDPAKEYILTVCRIKSSGGENIDAAKPCTERLCKPKGVVNPFSNRVGATFNAYLRRRNQNDRHFLNAIVKCILMTENIRIVNRLSCLEAMPSLKI